MTHNRARKIAARASAAATDVRLPEASYYTDHRTLLLLEDEPVVYNFSDGPLRFHGIEGLHLYLDEIEMDAVAKGWRIVHIRDMAKPVPPVQELRKEPTLVVVDVREPYEPGSLDPSVVRLITGEHPEVNVVVGLHSDEELPSGLERGRNKQVLFSAGTDYPTDDRKLSIGDGIIHDFSTGPVRVIGAPYGGAQKKARSIMAEATRKGWHVLSYPNAVSAAGLENLRGQPVLLLVDAHSEGRYKPSDLVQASLLEGERTDINVLAVVQFSANETLSAEGKARGSNIRIAPKSPPPTQRDRTTMQIVFARRYADLLSGGVDRVEALGFVTEDAVGFITPGSVELVMALRQAHQDMASGKSGEEVWGPHRGVLGNHLVRMLVTATSTDAMTSLLRTAAETLEADVRIGVA